MLCRLRGFRPRGKRNSYQVHVGRQLESHFSRDACWWRECSCGSVVLIGQVVILWWRFERDNWRGQWSEHENTARVAQQSVPITIETHQSSFQGVLSAPGSALSRMKRGHPGIFKIREFRTKSSKATLSPNRTSGSRGSVGTWHTMHSLIVFVLSCRRVAARTINHPSHARWLKTDFENKSCHR